MLLFLKGRTRIDDLGTADTVVSYDPEGDIDAIWVRAETIGEMVPVDLRNWRQNDEKRKLKITCQVAVDLTLRSSQARPVDPLTAYKVAIDG